jgi:hypothetical protein
MITKPAMETTKFWIRLTIFLFTFSCYSQVKVKFTNKSQENFKSLKIEVGKRKITFENIESGKSTEVVKLDGIFGYCRAQVITEKDTINFYPIDFMGEKYYKSGKLNLKLSIYTDEDGKRHLMFRK